MNVLVLLSIALLQLTSNALGDTPYTRKFNVEPGSGIKEFSIERDRITCKFEYQCTGKNVEQWRMVFTQIHELGTFGCAVEADSNNDSGSSGGHSLLKFSFFRLSAVGKVEAHQGFAIGNGGRYLNSDEFRFDKRLQRVERTDKFGGELARLAIEFSASANSEL